ncbi:MAG: restriction endonuclease subunit M [Candidatus Parcubacteria bacterium]|nr:MAG: restriction endonuclease subunit M [Candidatus Parcubacteria bacterium]
MEENYISTRDLARILGITRQAIQKMMKKYPNIKVKEVGGAFLYEIESLPEEIKEKIRKAREEAAEKLKLFKPEAYKDIDFEKELWKAADKLRGSIDPADYKHIVLGLIFLKYVSDMFYQRKQQLTEWVSDSSNTEWYVSDPERRKFIIEDKHQYRAQGVFYIPEKARWEYLVQHSMHHDIGRYLNEAMEAIEEENPKLKGVLPKVYISSQLESHVLGELINIFSKIKFDHDIDKEKDILGRVYEYFLGQFASAEGKRGGEFYTPRPIVRLIVEILEPYENCRVFDPACGSGGMFVQAHEFLKIHQKDPTKISFYGQELNITTLKLCKMNLAIRGIDGDIRQGNSYYDDKFPDLRADFVISNPPFNADWEPQRLSEKDPRLKYGIPPASNANFMWIQHFIYHLAPNGMVGFVMANGALAVGGKEGEIRKRIIEDDLVDVIIACPPKLFYNVSLPVSLWFLTKNKKNGRFRNRTGETLFIDARDIYTPISRKQNTFTDDQIIYIASIVKLYRGQDIFEETVNIFEENYKKYSEEKNNIEGLLKNAKLDLETKKTLNERLKELETSIEVNRKVKEEFIRNFSKGYKDINGLCKIATLEEIRKNGYVLTPGRYVGVPEEEDDGVPFEEKMKKLKSELEEYFKQSRELEEKIKENLEKINF